MQGNCQQSAAFVRNFNLPRDTVSLREVQQRQCILLTGSSLFWIAGGNLWLDALYIRTVGDIHDPAVLAIDQSQIWMTSLTLQGGGSGPRDCDVCGEVALSSQVFAEGDACSSIKPTCHRVSHASAGESDVMMCP